MKRFLKIILCFVLFLGFSNISVAKKSKQKHRVRSASSASGLVSKAKDKSKSSERKKSSKKSKASKKDKKDSKGSKKDSGDELPEQTEEISKTEQCMIDNLDTLLNGECKFLNETSIISSLSSKFYCIYNVKDKTKQDSVYNTFLYQNYGIKEASLKDGDSTIKIKNPSGNEALKGNAKYYEYILNSLDNGTLKDGKILDFLTAEVLDKNDELLADKSSVIESVSVQSTTIPADFTKKNIENCKKETKKIIQTCGITGNAEMLEKIDTNCSEYSTVLTNNAGNKKTKVLDSTAKLAKVLLNRAEAVTDAKSAKIALDKKELGVKSAKVDLEEQELNISKREQALSKEKSKLEAEREEDEALELDRLSSTSDDKSSDNTEDASKSSDEKDSVKEDKASADTNEEDKKDSAEESK